MEFIYFLVLLLVFLNLYLVFKTINLEKLSVDLANLETFETSVNTVVNDIYIEDIDAIRNLISISNNILKDNKEFYMPANKTYVKNLIIEGSINIQNKKSLLVNIFPKYMVIAWASPDIPLGWVICDGNRYSLNTNGVAIQDDLGDQTPDLRGRFILTFGIETDNINKLSIRKFGDKGGEENHELTVNEIPAHKHIYNVFNNNLTPKKLGTSFADRLNTYLLYQDSSMIDKNKGKFTVETGFGGGILKGKTGTTKDFADNDYPTVAEVSAIPHNNMPPYYVLTYIMKL